MPQPNPHNLTFPALVDQVLTDIAHNPLLNLTDNIAELKKLASDGEQLPEVRLHAKNMLARFQTLLDDEQVRS